MKYLFIEYPACSTCKKAKKWLKENNIDFVERHIVEQNPSYEELNEWISNGSLSLKKFFNTSGLVYKSLQLKDKLQSMSEEEQIRLLASDGKLIKRPLIISENRKTLLVGFKQEEWEKQIK